ncbi:MAG TPA: RNA methyltransferase [Bacteroidia bacterium]|nr:RNA methyltransferase [Bacteroidia bacterium]
MRKIRNDELDRKSVEEFKLSVKRPFILVLDNVRSLSNIGSVFRTADAFLCASVYLCGITARPPHREIHKTALGAEDSVDWKYFETVEAAISSLKASGYTIAAVEQVEGGTSLLNFDPDKTKKYAFIFGHEINGVSEEAIALCDLALEIPQQGSKHSLNVSVCAGVLAWDFVSKTG